MKRKLGPPATFATCIAVIGLCLLPAETKNGAAAPNVAQNQPEPGTAGPAADIHLVSPVPNGQWELPAGDYGNTRYSPLDQINTQNAKNLKMIATFSTGITHGHEGQPLVVNNTMYVVTPFPNNLLAFDLKNLNGPLKWKFEPHPDPLAEGRACCDTVNRGASYADGKIVYNALDNTTIAVDAVRGTQVWRAKVGDVNTGETTTGAPLIVRDKVYVGNSGGEFGVRGKVVCLDLKTGKEIWRAYSQGPDSDVRIGPDFKAFYAKDQGKDLGVKTWSGDDWKRGGGTVWGWISYDPETNLIFYGTGNPGVWDPDLRPGDKWSITIFARNADKGYAKWAYQVEAHDNYDYDEIMENIAIDMHWQGRMRKLLLHPARNGFMFVLDRETGEVLSAQKFMPTSNWASSYDLKTGLPNKNEALSTHLGKVASGVCPSSTGAKEFVPSAVSPRTGLLYIPAHNTCMNYQGLQANYIPGTPYLGASVKMYQGPGGFHGILSPGISKMPNPFGTLRTIFFRSIAAFWRRRATWSSTEPSKVSSALWMRAPDRFCGSSRRLRESWATRSRIWGRTVNSTWRSTPESAVGWERSRSRIYPWTIRKLRWAPTEPWQRSRNIRAPATISTFLGSEDSRFTMLSRIVMPLAILLAFAATACQQQSNASEAALPPSFVPIGPVPGFEQPPKVEANPYAKDTYAMTQGRKLFLWYNCAGCHGGHGGGGMGPSLRDQTWIYGSTDAQIFDSIAQGRGKGMPAWGLKVPELQIWQLVAYIKAMRTPQEPDPPE